jgi:PTH1 family peptidyl-tRNA hydrolase
MKLIVGLGNPGSEYEDTRHNIGFMVLDKLAKELGSESARWEEHEKFQAVTARAGDVMLVKPITFMNRSGDAISALMRFYKLSPSDVWVIHDDIDLPLGKIRVRERGSSAGHNGVQSVIESLKTDAFVRFRIGIGRGKATGKIRLGFFGQTGDDEPATTKNKDGIEKKLESERHQGVISFVLSRFTQGEAGTLKHLIKNGSEAVRTALTDGVDQAMTRFN